MRRIISVLVIVLFCTSCKGAQPLEETSALVNTSSHIDQGPMSSTEVLPPNTAVPSLDNTESSDPTKNTFNEISSNHIVWAVQIDSYIKEDDRKKVNRFLKNKGIDCQVEFVDVRALGVDYKDWLSNQKREGNAPDILGPGLWEHGLLDAPGFVADEFMPLDEYLKSEEGQELFNSYSDLEWRRTTVNGEIYSIPERLRDMRENGEIYLYLRDSAAGVFDENFDGTYDSLRILLEKNSDDESVIASEDLATGIVLAFLGMQEFYPVAYDPENRSFVDLTRRSEAKEFFRLLYRDIRDGIWVSEITPTSIPDNALCYVSTLKQTSLDGFTERVLSLASFRSRGSGSLGILATSTKKDLAFQVLCACFSDPEMASLLSWGEIDVEGWKERTRYLNTRGPSPITGFIPELTEEEHEILLSYYRDFNNLINRIYIYNNGKPSVNPDYEDYLDGIFGDPKDYGNIFDKLNGQLKRWFETGGN